MKHVIVGQKVEPIKKERSRSLRREMTEEEQLLWKHLRAGRFYGFHFRRQQVIRGFIVDFYCHSSNLVIEIDGEVHQRQKEYDAERDSKLIQLGFNILRFTNEEVQRDIHEVLSRIADFVKTSNSAPTEPNPTF